MDKPELEPTLMMADTVPPPVTNETVVVPNETPVTYPLELTVAIVELNVEKVPLVVDGFKK